MQFSKCRYLCMCSASNFITNNITEPKELFHSLGAGQYVRIRLVALFESWFSHRTTRIRYSSECTLAFWVFSWPLMSSSESQTSDIQGDLCYHWTHTYEITAKSNSVSLLTILEVSTQYTNVNKILFLESRNIIYLLLAGKIFAGH